MTQKVMTNDEAVIGSKIFFAIFGTFGRYITNLRDAFVENVKKVKNQPTLIQYTVVSPYACSDYRYLIHTRYRYFRCYDVPVMGVCPLEKKKLCFNHRHIILIDCFPATSCYIQTENSRMGESAAPPFLIFQRMIGSWSKYLLPWPSTLRFYTPKNGAVCHC
jgi:hypothetical protein